MSGGAVSEGERASGGAHVPPAAVPTPVAPSAVPSPDTPAPPSPPGEDPFAHWFEPRRLFAEGYPKRVSSALKMFPDLRFEIERIIATLAPKRALEIGPGDRPLIGGVRGAFFLDIVPAFLARLDVGRKVVGDVREAPFQSDRFDLVVAADLLTHVPPADRALAVSEMIRLAPRVLVFNPEAGTPEVQSSPVSTEEILSTFEDEGLEVERRDFVARAPKGVYRMALVYAARKGVDAK